MHQGDASRAKAIVRHLLGDVVGAEKRGLSAVDSDYGVFVCWGAGLSGALLLSISDLVSLDLKSVDQKTGSVKTSALCAWTERQTYCWRQKV